MNKPFLSIDQQIELLNSRGVITDKSRITPILFSFRNLYTTCLVPNVCMTNFLLTSEDLCHLRQEFFRF